jgi:tetratricopeptide (TPR) repeat protein
VPADRKLVVGLAAGAVAVVVALVLALGAGGSDQPGGAAQATSTTRDLGTVTDEELEQVVAENPDIVPMRLRLVERYLRDGELESAQRHAEEASVRATTIEDRARALRYLGWTTALLGQAEQGEGILVQSLALDPTNRDALYFLGRVRYQLLDRPDLALEPLEELAAMAMDDEQRRLVETLLAEVRVAVGIGATTTTAATPPTG